MSNKITTQLVIEGKNNSKKAFDEAEGSLNSLGSTAKAAAAALAGALSVSLFSEWVQGSIDAIDKTDELAERVGMAAGEFAGLQYAAKFASVESEALASGLTKFNQTITKAAEGSEKEAAAFTKIGVAVRDSAGNVKGAAPLLAEVADRFAALPDGPQKAALAIELFGKQGAKLLPLLNKGGAGIQALADQAKELGLILSEETYDAAGQFNDNLDVLAASASGAGQQVAADLLPALNDITGLLIDVSTNSTATSDAASILGGALKVLATIVVILGVAFKATGGLLAGLFAAMNQAAKGDLTGAWDTLQQAAEDYAETTEDGAKRIGKLWSGEYAAAAKTAAEVNEQLAGSFEAVTSGMGKSVEEATEHMQHLKAVQESLVKDAKQALSEQVAAQRKANADLKKAQDEQLATEKRYKEALAKLQAGTGTDVSYGAAQSLKVDARQALQNGNVEEAKAQAQAALDILQQLAAAGENTYGFAGFIKELQGIEEAADQVNVDKAKKSAEQAATAVSVLKEQLDAVKEVDVTVNLTPEEIAKITSQFQQLAAALGQQMVITPTVVAPDGVAGAAPPEIPGYAKGTRSAAPGLAWVGEKGPELLAFNGGEKVFTSSASQLLAKRLAGLSMPNMLSPELVANATAQPALASLGSINLSLGGGESLTLNVPAGQAANLKLLRHKFGSTIRPR